MSEDTGKLDEKPPQVLELLLVYNWVTELEGKGYCKKWDIRSLTVNRALMLSKDPRLESMGEMVEEPY